MPGNTDPSGAPNRDGELLAAAVADTLERAGQHLVLAGDDATPLLEGARRTLAGGKRLRGLLCLASARACGASIAEVEHPAVRAAAALEVFQAAALVHDDLMDDSDTRRGEPATHRWFPSQAPRPLAPESAERFGASGAILLGDLLLTLSATALWAAVAELDRPTQRQVRDLYDAMSTEVAFGQYLDLVAAHADWDGDAGLARAWRVITAKSARYSVELPLALGARIAGAHEDAVMWLTSIGRHVGTAFQLRDDLLGVFGDPTVTGKPAGDDLAEGKRTVLVALAHQRGDATARDLLRSHLDQRGLPPARIEALREVLRQTGAVDAVEHHIAEHRTAALELLAQPPAEVGELGALSALLHAAVDRTA